eukprot:10584_1
MRLHLRGDSDDEEDPSQLNSLESPRSQCLRFFHNVPAHNEEFFVTVDNEESIEMKASKAGKKKPTKKKAAGDEVKGNATAEKDAG